MTQRKEQKQIPCVCDKHYIKEQLQGMGVRKGMVLLVQGKMEKLGKIIGGAQTLIDAIMKVIGYEGTLVMPAFTPYKKDPACLWDGKEYREQWEQIRKGERPFDRKLDAPRNTLAAQFMRNEGVLRSHHPLYSFLAWGKYAKVIVEKHPLHFGLNEESPLGKLCELNGYVLLFGCGYASCAVFQMANHALDLPVRLVSVPIAKGGETAFQELLDIPYQNDVFQEVGMVMEARKIVEFMYINNDRCRLFSAREAVNIAITYGHLKNGAFA